MTAHPSITKAAQKMRGELNRYFVVRDIIRCFDVYDFEASKVVYSASTAEVCREWIDEQAFIVGLEALLPLEDEDALIYAATRKVSGEFGPASFENEFEAAIKHLTSGRGE